MCVGTAAARPGRAWNAGTGCAPGLLWKLAEPEAGAAASQGARSTKGRSGRDARRALLTPTSRSGLNENAPRAAPRYHQYVFVAGKGERLGHKGRPALVSDAPGDDKAEGKSRAAGQAGCGWVLRERILGGWRLGFLPLACPLTGLPALHFGLTEAFAG